MTVHTETLTDPVEPAVTSHAVATQNYGNSTGAPAQGFVYDLTGQIAPPGSKPRVTATLWEDEGSLCYQVEAKGVCVARREGEMEHIVVGLANTENLIVG